MAASAFKSSRRRTKCSAVEDSNSTCRYSKRSAIVIAFPSSPRLAKLPASNSELVAPPKAETTTKGFREILSPTMPQERSIAAASSTEVPPNFITIMSRE
jgi:hypothetical protein